MLGSENGFRLHKHILLIPLNRLCMNGYC
uniref:Uncharacterized protein n=1 Tax=Anguilla anguilla TaxID=7936 RepID=A0A0E9W3K4_ANGAN